MDASVETLAQSFVSVRVDSDDREDLVRLWEIHDLPGFVFFTPDGGVLARAIELVGKPADITAHMEKALTALERFRKAQENAKKSLGSVKRQKQLADQYVLLQMWDSAAKQLEHVVEIDPRDAHKGHEATVESMVYVELMRGRFEKAVEQADAFTGRWPEGASLARVLYWRGLALHRMKRGEDAVAQWEDVAKRFPDDATAKLAQEAIARAKKGR